MIALSKPNWNVIYKLKPKHFTASIKRLCQIVVLMIVLKVPVRSNFPNFMFVQFSKVYVAVTYQAKQFFNPSTGSPFFLTVFLAILRPPLIGYVPTAQ